MTPRPSRNSCQDDFAILLLDDVNGQDISLTDGSFNDKDFQAGAIQGMSSSGLYGRMFVSVNVSLRRITMVFFGRFHLTHVSSIPSTFWYLGVILEVLPFTSLWQPATKLSNTPPSKTCLWCRRTSMLKQRNT